MSLEDVFVKNSPHESKSKVVFESSSKHRYRRTSKIQLLTIVIVLLLFLSGCKFMEGNSPNTLTNTLTITPVELYGGDKDKFQPFLGYHSGSVKLEYTGEKKRLAVIQQLWENGKPSPQTVTREYDLMFDLDEERDNFNAEIIASIKDIRLDQSNYYEVTLSIITNSGSSTTTHYMERDEKHSASLFKELHEDISIDNSGEAVVMGVEVSTSGNLVGGTIDQAKENAEWFYGISVILTDEEGIFP